MAKRRWAMLTEGIVRVLVFDGDDDYRRTLSAHLMSAGMEVMAYGHGGTTLDEALHSGPCDAALFNVHLPVESGFSLPERLRLVSDGGPGLPIGRASCRENGRRCGWVSGEAG